MNIIDAIKSGRRFKRPNDREWWGVCEANGYIAPVGCVDECHSILPSTAENLLADDYILEEPEIRITATQFWCAFADTLKWCEADTRPTFTRFDNVIMSPRRVGEELARRLGLGEER